MRLWTGSLSAGNCLVPVGCALQWRAYLWHLPASKEYLLLELLDAAKTSMSHLAAVKHSGHICVKQDSGKPEHCIQLLSQQGRTLHENAFLQMSTSRLDNVPHLHACAQSNDDAGEVCQGAHLHLLHLV